MKYTPIMFTFLRIRGTGWAVLSRIRLFATPSTVPRQAPLSMGISRQKYWSGLPFPPPRGPNPRIEPRSPEMQAVLYRLSPQGSPRTLEWVSYPLSKGPSDPGIKLGSPALQADSLPAELPGKPRATD